MTDLQLDSLLQVEDTSGNWHAAHVGRGVLCGVARVRIDHNGHMEPLVDTVRWDYGLDFVDCATCLGAVLQLGLLAA